MSSQHLFPTILYPQGGMCRLPLPHKITSMSDTQEPTRLYKYQGSTWKLVQDK
jgi:hypothetical protein